MDSIPLVTRATIDLHYTLLSQIGNLGSTPDGKLKGFCRAPWSDEETKAICLVQASARFSGLITLYDAVGNLRIRTPGDHTTVFAVGSHLDTVPNGGNYDGAAGVIAGLEAIKTLWDARVPLQRGLELIVWRGEESATRGVAYVGSKAATGTLDPAILTRTWRGSTLAHAMESQNVDPTFVQQQKQCFPDTGRQYLGYLELHIEQGRVLEQSDIPIGIVTSIFGNKRYWVELEGQADHSGATAMNDRKDTHAAYAAIHMALEKLYQREGSPTNVVWTNTMFNRGRADFDVLVDENTGNTSVPGYAYFRFETRSNNNTLGDSYATKALRVIEGTARSRDVIVRIHPDSSTPALEQLDISLTKALKESARYLGYGHTNLPSGGGHDGVVVSSVGIPVGMLFIPCRNGMSHSPLELANHEHIAMGANVLAQALYNLAK